MLRNKESQLQLLWWVKIIEIYNGRTLIQFPAQALFKDRGEGSQGRNENWRDMDSAGQKDTPKRTGTSCIKTSPGNLFESTGDKVTAYSDGQYSGLALLSENGCSKNLQMVCLSKQIWEVLLRKKETVIAEYFPKALNKHADRILSQDRFFRMEASLLSVPKTVKMGKTLIDLFASRVSH